MHPLVHTAPRKRPLRRPPVRSGAPRPVHSLHRRAISPRSQRRAGPPAAIFIPSSPARCTRSTVPPRQAGVDGHCTAPAPGPIYGSRFSATSPHSPLAALPVFALYLVELEHSSTSHRAPSVRIHGHEERDAAGDPGLGAVRHQEPSCVSRQQEDRGRVLQGRRVRGAEPQLRGLRGERAGHPQLARVAGPPVHRHRRQGRAQLRAGEAHRGRARAHHHAVPPGVRVRGPDQAGQEPGAAPHGGDRLRPHRAAGGGRRGAHRGRGHGQQHGVGGGGPADAHPRPHAQLPPGAPPGHQRGVGPRRHRAPGLRPGGQDGGHRRRRPHREAAAPAPQALRLQPALPRQAPHRRRAGEGAGSHVRGGARRHAAQVRRRRAQHATHREDQRHVQQGEDRQDEERRDHRQQRSWSHHGHAGSCRRLQKWPHRWIRWRRVVPAAGAQGPPVALHAQQRHDPSHLRHHHRWPAEVRRRGEGHAGEVLQGPGLPGAQLHRQGRQARQPVPVSIHGVRICRPARIRHPRVQKLNKDAWSLQWHAISHKYICLNKME